ncbi:MAG TPA: hypothetical protein VE957_09905 [Terriglobales bacterium]|nr:hypothetical protein [Terriglobales bacterium]
MPGQLLSATLHYQESMRANVRNKVNQKLNVVLAVPSYATSFADLPKLDHSKALISRM